ncbi:MAG: hypothetical protein HUJ11_08370 [Arenibacter algicola]|nr:hypothetical protein [Arenibacter algicola]
MQVLPPLNLAGLVLRPVDCLTSKVLATLDLEGFVNQDLVRSDPNSNSFFVDANIQNSQYPQKDLLLLLLQSALILHL